MAARFAKLICDLCFTFFANLDLAAFCRSPISGKDVLFSRQRSLHSLPGTPAAFLSSLLLLKKSDRGIDVCTPGKCTRILTAANHIVAICRHIFPRIIFLLDWCRWTLKRRLFVHACSRPSSTISLLLACVIVINFFLFWNQFLVPLVYYNILFCVLLSRECVKFYLHIYRVVLPYTNNTVDLAIKFTIAFRIIFCLKLVFTCTLLCIFATCYYAGLNSTLALKWPCFLKHSKSFNCFLMRRVPLKFGICLQIIKRLMD